MRLKKMAYTAMASGGLLVMAWLLPPIIHTARKLCPVRLGGVRQAQAVPAFARKYGISCSQCHSAFPVLNDYGRQFKMNGYVREQGNKEGVLDVKNSDLWMLNTFPWGALAKSRPYDKKNSKDEEFRFRPLHELELFIAGGDVARKMSYFTEIEMEDEPDAVLDSAGNEEGAFHPKVGNLQLGYHPSRYANILVANRSFFEIDPYQTLSNFGRLTVSERLFANKTGGATNLDDAKQTAVIYGRLEKEGLGSLYYAGGLTAQNNDPEGKGYKSEAFRVAFDTLKGVMVGAFGHFGHEGGPARAPVGDKTQFSRVGVDALVELMGFTGRAAIVQHFDKNLSSQVRENNRGAYTEVFYAYDKDDRPFLVPSVRQDWYTTGDGRRQVAAFSAQMAHYLRENVKWFVEYSGDTKQDAVAGTPRAQKDHRWIAQLEVGF